ncbi:IspD/TarI family cytidylyltransferase [Pseudonocardia sp.]|uniref:IspD/TarI family cytidylyltransferase n=1 Tax=Pseudonocardia sp. TaxID=60912 RepID=UPI003D151027
MTEILAAAVVLAGGSGTRVGADRNKVLLPVAGRPVLARSLATFVRMPEIGPIVLVTRPQERAAARAMIEADPDLAGAAELLVVDGGASRQESELSGLRALSGRVAAGLIDAVLVHDGARPLATPELAREVLAMARAHGGAVPGVAVPDLAVAAAAAAVTESDDMPFPVGERLTATVPGLVAVQTPQGFRAGPLLAACEAALRDGFVGTDTASCVERYAGVGARWVVATGRNLKITYARDLPVAERALTAAESGRG